MRVRNFNRNPFPLLPTPTRTVRQSALPWFQLNALRVLTRARAQTRLQNTFLGPKRESRGAAHAPARVRSFQPRNTFCSLPAYTHVGQRTPVNPWVPHWMLDGSDVRTCAKGSLYPTRGDVPWGRGVFLRGRFPRGMRISAFVVSWRTGVHIQCPPSLGSVS